MTNKQNIYVFIIHRYQKRNYCKRSTMASPNPSTKNNEKIIFKSDKHAAFISEKLQNFYEKNEFFDTVLIAGSDRVKVHRVVLCALSDYFLEIFRQSMLNVVELHEIEASTLKLIIDFMYSGSIELSLETVEGILRTASFLKIKTLIDGCCALIENNVISSNSLKNFRLANELSLSELKSKALECTYTHFEEVSKGKELLTLSKNELMDLLFNDNHHGDIEEYVFLSMVAWINYDKPTRGHLVFQLLSMVRFQALTPKFIIENRKSVCKTVKSYELICSWLQWHLSPETRSKDHQIRHFKPRKMLNKLAVIKVIEGKKINIEAFQSVTNVWDTEIETSLPIKRVECSVCVADGKPIVVGGNDCQYWTKKVLYLDIQTLKWIDLPETDKSRGRCQLVDLKGHLCAFGGDIRSPANSMELYNFSTSKWKNIQPPATPTKTSQIAAHNGMLYLLDFGIGFLQCYDVSTNKWILKAVEKQSLINFGFSAVEGFLYVIGGYQGQALTKVKRYDLSDDSWHDMASLPQPRCNIKTTVFENKIIICDNLNVDAYNFESDTWNSMSPLSKDEGGEVVNICTLPATNN